MPQKGFPLYNIKLRLGGSLFMETIKRDVTAPEVMMYGNIHGLDSVQNVEPSMEPGGKKQKISNVTPIDERNRLVSAFERSPDKKGAVRRMFGPSASTLPHVLDENYQAETTAVFSTKDTDADMAELARQAIGA